MEQAKENLEANKVGWVDNAAKLIATNTYQISWTNLSATEDLPHEFLDCCINEALVALELEHFEHD